MTRLLCVFAHPDDDVTIGPLLAHYARRGIAIRLIYVTSGQVGDNLIGPETGDALGALREEEARAACRAYGAQEPLFLRERDGTLASLPTQAFLALGQRIAEIIRREQPQLVITFGPDGYTRHPDHKAVCSLVTDLLQRWPQEVTPAPPLYYMALPQPAAATLIAGGFPETGLSWTHPRHITHEIAAADGIQAAIHALHCYRSQFGPAEMTMLEALHQDLLEGRIPLRAALPTVTEAQRQHALPGVDE